MIGSFFVVTMTFKARCCSRWFVAGQVLQVTGEPSPNRFYIVEENSWGHNVKRSTFLRCCIKKETINDI